MTDAKKNASQTLTETTETATSKINIKQFNVKSNIKKDFSETLEITRTLFKNVVSKTSIVEASLACASAQAESFTCTQIAKFIIKNLNVNDCFHKRETNKSNDALRATILRVRHHVVDTLRTHHKADKLYAYNKATDSISFTELYRALCTDDKAYRLHVSALIKKVKVQYKATVKTVKKTTKIA